MGEKKNKIKFKTLGFTLVELLAVVVILALVLAIAIPSIITVIENARTNAFISNEQMMARATTNYIALNEEKLPNEIGETKEVTLEQLKTADVIAEINSPFHNDNCNGYVLITKIGDNSYDYTPHLNCVDPEIGSVSTDELVLHYKFTDFQEYSENLYQNAAFKNGLSNWARSSSHYNAVDMEDGSVLLYRHTEGTGNWLLRQGLNWEVGDTFTISLEAKRIDSQYYGTNEFNFGVGIWSLEPLWSSGTVKTSSVAIVDSISDGWWRIEVPLLPATNSGSTGHTFLHSVSTMEDRYLIRNPQLEEKPYATPFVDGVREGIIKDYSINNNIATLNEQTPRWVEEGASGIGAYKFNGQDNYIPVSSTRMNAITLSLWFKTNSSAEQVMIGGVFSTNSWGNLNMHNGRLSVRQNSNVISTVNRFDNGEWNHLVIVQDMSKSYPDRFEFYINGALEPRTTGGNNRVSDYFEIGRRHYQDIGELYYNGYLDEIKIYNRMLSADEIKIMYQAEKSINHSN